ncbi:hypothetical protein ANTRET_LOCUS9016 [Anthophora retusa]
MDVTRGRKAKDRECRVEVWSLGRHPISWDQLWPYRRGDSRRGRWTDRTEKWTKDQEVENGEDANGTRTADPFRSGDVYRCNICFRKPRAARWPGQALYYGMAARTV